jgi:hypothetical protein
MGWGLLSLIYRLLHIFQLTLDILRKTTGEIIRFFVPHHFYKTHQLIHQALFVLTYANP